MDTNKKDFRKEFKKNKKSLVIFCLLLCVVGIGIGYALLTETLFIKNTVSFEKMKWNVGFSDYVENLGTISSSVEIGENGKSLTVTCGVIQNTDPESCIAKATIKNDSSFNIGLSEEPKIIYDDTYIHTLTFKWVDHPTYKNTTVHKNGFIESGKSQDVIITIKTKRLTEKTLPTTNTEIPVTIELNFAEWEGGELPKATDLAILASSGCSVDMTAETLLACGETFAGIPFNIMNFTRNIYFEDNINVPADIVGTWDLSQNQNGKVMAYAVPNTENIDENYTFYDLYIQSDGQLYANADMTGWFSHCYYLNSINGLNLLDTSMTTNMSGMFVNMTALNDNELYTLSSLDLSNFDTSSVTNMMGMFAFTGMLSSGFTLDVSGFDTSNVTDMASMFCYTGQYSKVLTLDVSNFDTSSVTDMSDMFNQTGYSNPTFTLDVSGFDTSQVKDMGVMFRYAGYKSTVFALDLSNFDTSNVTIMDSMLEAAGYSSTKLNTSITIRNPNASYSSMFYDVATEPGTKIIVNYTSDTENIIDNIINTKTSDSNVVKGSLVN